MSAFEKLSRIPALLKTEGVEGIRRRASYLKWKHLGFLYRLLNIKYVRSTYGVKLRANYEDATFDFYCKGAYGRFYSSIIERIQDDFCFLDVGANQGLYAILAAQNPKCRQVFAFEPVKRTAAFCAENIAANGVEEKITLVNKAISNKQGTVGISVNSHHSGAASLTGSSNEGTNGLETVELADHHCLDELSFSSSVPVYVKVDVEGHEETVIRELFHSQFSDHIVQIFYECNERWVSASQIQALLRQRNFEMEKVGTGAHYDVLATRKAGLPASG